jgi:ATP-dependent DNA helicase HFM1/MER3
LNDILRFQIDEIHLLKEDRGAVLEVVIARMKLRTRVRFVAVSATVPNIQDVSKWIGEGRSESGLSASSLHLTLELPATTLVFGEEYRPVKLERYCYGYPQSGNDNDFQFEHRLNNV